MYSNIDMYKNKQIDEIKSNKILYMHVASHTLGTLGSNGNSDITFWMFWTDGTLTVIMKRRLCKELNINECSG